MSCLKGSKPWSNNFLETKNGNAEQFGQLVRTIIITSGEGENARAELLSISRKCASTVQDIIIIVIIAITLGRAAFQIETNTQASHFSRGLSELHQMDACYNRYVHNQAVSPYRNQKITIHYPDKHSKANHVNLLIHLNKRRWNKWNLLAVYER